MDHFNLAISTVNKISLVLKIRPPQVYIHNVQDFSNPHVSSMYVSSKDAIVFISSWIEQVDVIEVVAAAIHETRHAFHYYCVKNNANDQEKKMLEEVVDNIVVSNEEVCLYTNLKFLNNGSIDIPILIKSGNRERCKIK